MKRTPFALALALLAAAPGVLFAQDEAAQKARYHSYLLQCQMLKKSQVVQDNTALEKVDYALYQRQQLLKKQFPDPVDPDKDADGCMTYAAWLKLYPSATTTTGTAKPAAKKSTTGAKKKPAPTKTVQTTPTQQTPTQQTPTQTAPKEEAPAPTQTAGGGSTAPTQTSPTAGTGTTTPDEQSVKSKMGPPTEEEWLLQNKSSQDLLLLNKEGGSTKNSPTMDGSQDQSGVVKVDGKKDGKKKLFDFSKDRKKKSADVPNLAAGPDATKPPEHKRTVLDKLLGRNREPVNQGPLEGQAGSKKGAEDFGNMMGGAKFAAYSGLLAALFLTGPGALAGIILFAALGFFSGYWVTKKNG